MLWKGRRQSVNIRDLREGVEMTTATINIARLDAAVASAFPAFEQAAAAKVKLDVHPEVKNAMTKVGFAGIPGTQGIDAGLLTFCKAWTKVRPLFNAGLKMAAWVPGMSQYVGLAKAFLTALDTEIIPVVCKP